MRENFTVNLTTVFDFYKIPFDSQKLEFQLGSLTWDADYVKILPEDQTVFFDDDFVING